MLVSWVWSGYSTSPPPPPQPRMVKQQPTTSRVDQRAWERASLCMETSRRLLFYASRLREAALFYAWPSPETCSPRIVVEGDCLHRT